MIIVIFNGFSRATTRPTDRISRFSKTQWIGSGRVGSGRVGSGRVGSGGVLNLTGGVMRYPILTDRVRSGHPEPT